SGITMRSVHARTRRKRSRGDLAVSAWARRCHHSTTKQGDETLRPSSANGDWMACQRRQTRPHESGQHAEDLPQGGAVDRHENAMIRATAVRWDLECLASWTIPQPLVC